MEKDILKSWDDNTYHTVDPRCRYWLLTRPRKGYRSNDGPEKDAKYVEGVIQIQGDMIIWQPIGFSERLLYPRFEFTYENFIILLHSIEGIMRVTPGDILKIYTERHTVKEYIYGTSVYLEHDIPCCFHKCGCIAVYISCNDKFKWEEILNESAYKEE